MTSRYKRILKYILLLIAFTSLTTSSYAQVEGAVVDRLIAVVGDEIILESEVFQNAQSIALQQGGNILNDPQLFQELREKVLKEMINQKILLARAKEDSIVVEPRDVDRELENRLQSIIQNVGSEEKLEEMYGYSIRRIRRDFKMMVQENLMVERVKHSYLHDIRVTRDQIEQYFDEHPEDFPQMNDAVELAHILRETGGSDLADERSRVRADSIYDAIKAGASFDSLAFAFSEDEISAQNYGSIGWTEKGDLISNYEEAAYVLKPGEISRPVRTRFGYHVIRLEERRENKIRSSHILIIPQVTEEDEQPVVDFLNSLREEIITGISFSDMVNEYSQDLESAEKDGYLGWFSLEEMPEEFQNNIKELGTGDISLPFKTQYGYHLVKVISKREARAVALDQDWELISQYVLNAKREKAYQAWLVKLKARYYIEIKG